MEAPDKIYLGIQDLGTGYVYNISLDNNGEQKYIRKDALIEWAKYQMSFEQGYDTGEAEHAYRFAMMDLIEKLNTI